MGPWRAGRQPVTERLSGKPSWHPPRQSTLLLFCLGGVLEEMVCSRTTDDNAINFLCVCGRLFQVNEYRSSLVIMSSMTRSIMMISVIYICACAAKGFYWVPVVGPVKCAREVSHNTSRTGRITFCSLFSPDPLTQPLLKLHRKAESFSGPQWSKFKPVIEVGTIEGVVRYGVSWWSHLKKKISRGKNYTI